MDHRSNEIVCQQINIETYLLDDIRTRCLEYFDHISRRDGERGVGPAGDTGTQRIMLIMNPLIQTVVGMHEPMLQPLTFYIKPGLS